MNYYRFIIIFLALYPTLNLAETTLSEVVVTANRYAKTSPLASVTVINREEISRAANIYDVLRGVPGLDITSNGGLGQSISIFMRGTESDHLLVLIDGIKIGSATTGSAAFEHLPISQIERIEIVRGPRSSLYGSEAIGGVIQIFTRHSKKPQVEGSIGIGADNTYRVTTGFSATNQNSWLSLYVNQLKSDGFNACKNAAGCFTVEPDDDGYENTAFSTKFGHRFGDIGSIEVNALRAEGNTQFDSSFNNEADFTQQAIGIKADYTVNDWWLLNINIGESQDKFDENPQSYFHTTRTVYGLQNGFFFDAQELILGYEGQIDDVGSNVDYAIDSLTNKGIFAEYQVNFDTVDLLFGVRQDDNEQFGNHTTNNISLGYALNSKVRFIASYGTAFKAPSFNELYFPNYGNSNLNPEESKSYEIGLIGNQQHYNWSVNIYKTKIDKLIATNFDAINNNYYADNINKANISGLDGSIGWQQNHWEFNTKISWLKPEDDTTGNLLPRRAKKTINVELAERRGAMRLGINILAQSHRYDDANNTRRSAGYGIVNLTAEYNFSKNWTLRAKLENMLGKEYETAYAFNTPDQFWLLSLNYQR